MGINTLAKTIYGIDARLAGRLVDGDYNANKDYRDNKYLTDSCDSLTSRLEPFLTDNVVKSFSGSSFRVADILTNERPVTIYLKWPESKLSAVQPVMKLLWGTFVEELKNVTNPRHKMLFLIDEGGVTPIPELYKHVATVNGRGMSFVIGIQDLSQLEGLYPTYYKTILNNCAQVFFRQQSLETAKYVSELLGGKSAFSSSQSIHGEETSEAKHEQKVALMSPQEIRGMGGTLLVFHPDLRYAIKARRMPEFVKPETAPLLLAPPQIPKSSIIWADNPAITP
jgi:type IV secretion system protein VirD4